MASAFENDDWAVCPYNESHKMLKHRLNTHLVKCRKNYPKANKVKCEFNSTHIINEPEMKYHYSICNDKKRIEMEIIASKTTEKKYPIPNICVPCEESWDDYNCRPYDPSEYVLNNNILRQLNVEPNSVKRNFRMNERKRLQDLVAVRNENGYKGNVKIPQHRAVKHIDEVDIQTEKLKQLIISGKNMTVIPGKSGIKYE